MKKKIAILEIEYHLGFIKTLVDIIDFNKYSVTIFTTTNNKKDLVDYIDKKNLKKIKIITNKDSILSLLYNFFKISKKFDLCFHFSIQDFFLLLPFRFLFFPRCKTIFVTFRVEQYLGNFFYYPPNIYKFKDIVINFCFNIIRYLTIKKAIAIIVNGTKDAKIIKTKFYNKKVFIIPYKVSTLKKSTVKNKNKLIIGVPGSIDSSRRNYFKIIDTFKILENDRKYFQLIFIGSDNSNQTTKKLNKIGFSPYFRKLIEEIKKLNQKGFKIKYFDKKLSQKTYLKYIRSADIIMSYKNNNNMYSDYGWTNSYTEAIEHNKYLLTNIYKCPKNISYIRNTFKNSYHFKRKIIEFKRNRSKFMFLNLEKINKYFSHTIYKKKMASILSRL